MSKVIVVGGGASGLVASIYASKNNDVVVLEKNSKCAKKILVTGNGKCNYWNSDFTKDHFNFSDSTWINSIITKENKEEIMNFFDSIGIIPNIKNGYYYPMSNQAISINTSLIKEAELRGVNIITDTEVLNVSYDKKYIIETSNGVYEADKLIISTGSHAYIQDKCIGYNILRKFNHKINPVLPALVQLESHGSFLKKWAGVRIDAELSLYENNKLISNSSGEVQLTDYGISGICTFQLSSIVSIGLYNNKKECIHINFMPYLNDNFIDFMNDRNKKVNSRTISELLDGLFNYKLSNTILELCNIKLDDKWDCIDNSKKEMLAKKITDFKIDITGTKGYKNAQTCTGGVDIKEINPKTMESLIKKDLYITGEIIDVDGQCGGYNLGFAFLTGMIAGRGVNDKN